MRLFTRDFLDERLVPELEKGSVQYFDHIRRYLFAQQDVGAKRVLDVACGTGYGSDILKRGQAARVVGVDIDENALAYAAKQWQLSNLFQADALHLPFRSHTFDVIVSFETIEHLPEPRAFLHELMRLLAVDGHLILSVPNRRFASPNSDTPYSPYHTFEPTRTELLELLRVCGWSVQTLYGLEHSLRAAALLRPVMSAFAKQAGTIAWQAYLRRAVIALLPPLLYRLISRAPVLDVSDSVLSATATDNSAYFIAVCYPINR